jgi:cyclopropane fatty-acyl-phospholipid synthase-like methyltransferase
MSYLGVGTISVPSPVSSVTTLPGTCSKPGFKLGNPYLRWSFDGHPNLGQPMTEPDDLDQYLAQFPRESPHLYLGPDSGGYWSNLSKQQNAELVSLLGTCSTRDAIAATQPQHSEVIFSPKRAAALELLGLDGSEVAVDLGCMWGALTIPLAKQTARVLAVDQTLESLKFSEARAIEEDLDNVNFLRGNLRDLALPASTFDLAVVNGVLEWIPEVDPIVVDDYWHGAKERQGAGDPGEVQIGFLRKVHASLRQAGRLFLAIENRYDYKMFCGVPDPHTGTRFTTIAPRWLANVISKVRRRREYRTWIYSFADIRKQLHRAGFSTVSLYACWPDYRQPEHIQPYGAKNEHFRPMSSRRDGRRTFKATVANRLEWLLFKKLDIQSLAPSIIAIAEK